MTSEKDDDHIALSIPHRDGPAYPLSPSTRSPDGSVNATKQESEGERSKNITQACRIIGTFFIFFITWGVASSFSAYQAFYQQDLLADHTPSEISWIGTSQVSLLGFTGVVSGALYDRGYIRALLIVGGTMVVFGFMMLSLAKEYYQVILSQGLCIGLGEPPHPISPAQADHISGNGMLYIPSIAVISQTFTAKYRPIAIGGSSSGAAIGGIVLPIVSCPVPQEEFSRQISISLPLPSHVSTFWLYKNGI
jgi:MFS family permease